MTTTFALPDLGEGIGEAEVVNWLVEVGDPVEEDQPIVEVETDKAVVDVPSPVDGLVAERLVDEGETVAVGTDIVVFETDEADADALTEEAPDADSTETGTVGEQSETDSDPDTDTPTGEKIVAAPRVRQLAREVGVDIETVSPAGDDQRLTERDVLAAAEDADPESLAGGADDEDVLATPHARKVAQDRGVDLAAVSPSGTLDGEAYVSTADVESYADAQTSPPERSTADREEREPYRGIRRTIGEQMERSRFTAPHATTLDEVLVDDLVAVREDLANVAAEQGVSLTYTPFIIKAVTAALQEYPYLNASLDEANDEIVKKYHYDIGVAIGANRGLVVPVIRDADQKDLLEIAEEIADFAERAESGDLGAEEMQGGTFTVTNIGMVGGEYGTPVINYPEVAILSVGTVKKKPRVVDDDIVARHVMPLSLSIDHRVVDGIVAVEFLNAIERQLHEPARILVD